jgi:NADH-quinone oxidoreductase subunit N
VSFVSAVDLRMMLPEIWLTSYGLVLLLLSAVWPAGRRKGIGWLALLGIAATAAILIVTQKGALVLASGASPRPGAFAIASGAPSFMADGFSLYFKLLFLAAAALTILMSLRYLDYEKAQAGEYYALILIATVGMMFMASGTDFVVLYIGLELMALSIYVLVDFTRQERRSNEAALKYFLLGAFSSGIFLYGVSLIYGTTGATNLLDIKAAVAAGVDQHRLLVVGAILATVGLAFKVAAVPFHMWTPDAYEGAPTAITAFMSTAVKAAAFAFMLRIYVDGLLGIARDWVPLIALLAAASMTVGNITAILQDNVKRLLAYSSIAHAGYALMGLVAIGALDGSGARLDGLGSREYGLMAILVYMGVYTFMNLGAFAVVVKLRRETTVGDRIEDFTGIGRSHPALGFAMLVFLLSLAGIPCTAGFIGKWWLFGAALRAGYGWLAVLAVVNSAISLYYYVRIVVVMFMGAQPAPEAPSRAPGLLLATTAALVMTFWIGLYPAPLLGLVRLALLPIGP